MGLEGHFEVLSDHEIERELKSMPDWARDGLAIAKLYHFESFLEAIAFVNRVAAVATELDHHPDIMVSYDEVRVRTWTHKKDAVTRADFMLARKIDEAR